jgi:hypothetical protein
MMLGFSTSEGLFMWIGCLKVRPLIKEVLTTLHEWVRRRPDTWKNNSWVLHQDNTLAHNALSFKTFLMKHKITVLEHPPCSLALTPCEFFLFPKIKFALKGPRCESIDAVKAKAMELMNKLSEDHLQHCFQQWKIRMSLRLTVALFYFF